MEEIQLKPWNTFASIFAVIFLKHIEAVEKFLMLMLDTLIKKLSLFARIAYKF